MLPGSSEGIYGFVAANYANGALQQAAPDPESFLGVVELGGASLQVLPQPKTCCDVECRELDMSKIVPSFTWLGKTSSVQMLLLESPSASQDVRYHSVEL